MIGTTGASRRVRRACWLALPLAIALPSLALAQADDGEPQPVSGAAGPQASAAAAGGYQLNAALGRLAQNPRDIDALLGAGTAALAIGDKDAAIGFLTRADQLSPGNPRVKATLAGALVRDEDPFAAIPLFDEAERAGASVAALAGDRGLAYDLVGANLEAQKYYRQALAAGANYDEVLRRLAVSQAIAGDRRGFDATLTPQLQRQDPAAWRARAFGLAILGAPDDAVQIANRTMPPALAQGIAPYLRYMRQLTPAQQAAAANFGHFPRAAQIGRDDPRVARYAALFPRPASPAAALAQAVQPSGRGKKGRDRDDRKRRGRDAAPVQVAIAARPTPWTSAAPPPVPQPRLLPPAPTVAPAPLMISQATSPAPAVARPAFAPPSVAALPPAATSATSLAARPAVIPAPQPAPAPAMMAIQTAVTPPPAMAVPVATPAPTAVLNAVGPAPSPAIVAPAAPMGPPSSPATLANLTPAGPPSAREAPAIPAPARPADFATAFSAFRAPTEQGAGTPGPATPAPVAPPVPPITPAPLVGPPAREGPPEPPPATRSSEPAPALPAGERLASAEARPTPAPPTQPSRIWLQLGSGNDRAALADDWRRMARRATEELKDKRPWLSAADEGSRLLVGPFGSLTDARLFLSYLREDGVSASVWTSPAGQPVERLPLQ